MSQFTGPSLKLDFFNEEGRDALLLERILYEIGFKGSGDFLEIEVGFKSDGATIPTLLWWFLPPWGSKASKAILVHDKLLDLIKDGVPHHTVTTRKQADQEFAKALRALSVPEWRISCIYCGVRAFAGYRVLFPKK